MHGAGCYSSLRRNQQVRAWAVYSLLVQRIAGFGYPVILTTRRIFCWGLAMMLPLWIGTGKWASLPGLVRAYPFPAWEKREGLTGKKSFPSGEQAELLSNGMDNHCNGG